MDYLHKLNIPTACRVNKTIFKKLFYENSDLSSSDKALFTDVIDKVTWLYCLKPETINVQPLKDDIRDYPEIEVIEIVVLKDIKLKRIAEIIMRTIPYPMLLIFKFIDKTQLIVAHQRTNQNDSSKNTIEEFIFTEWLNNENPLFNKLDIKQMRFTNFYTLYSDIVDVISIYNLSSIMSIFPDLTGEEARQMLTAVEKIKRQVVALRERLKKETQFNCRMEINVQIKKLEQQKENLIGGAV